MVPAATSYACWWGESSRVVWCQRSGRCGDCHQGSGAGAACPGGGVLGWRRDLKSKADDRGEQSSMASELDPTGAGRGGQRVPAECARASRWRGRATQRGEQGRHRGRGGGPAVEGRQRRRVCVGRRRLWGKVGERCKERRRGQHGCQPCGWRQGSSSEPAHNLCCASTNPVSCASSAVVAKERSARPGSREGEPHRRGEGQRRTIGPGQQGRHTVRRAGVPAAGVTEAEERGAALVHCEAQQGACGMRDEERLAARPGLGWPAWGALGS